MTQTGSRNIILIGMPGVGKSTVGVVLAKSMGMAFVDTDLVIQEQTGFLLQEIIDQKGLDAFAGIEEDVLTGLDVTGSVVATGGSAVYSDAAMKHLGAAGPIVYLRASCEEIISRIHNLKSRGIALKPGMTLESLYAERITLYEKYADITVDSTGVEETVAAIRKALQEKGV